MQVHYVIVSGEGSQRAEQAKKAILELNHPS
jgi:hypothetical protein